MFNIPDQPAPAVSTALRAPQADLNARRIWRERRSAALPTFAITALILAAVATGGLIGAFVLERTAANVPHTLEQAERYRGM